MTKVRLTDIKTVDASDKMILQLMQDSYKRYLDDFSGEEYLVMCIKLMRHAKHIKESTDRKDRLKQKFKIQSEKNKLEEDT
jgi:heme oxygenase